MLETAKAWVGVGRCKNAVRASSGSRNLADTLIYPSLHGVNRRLKETWVKASDNPVSPGTARPVPGKVNTEYSRNFGGADTHWLAPQRAMMTVSGTTKSSNGRGKPWQLLVAVPA